MYIYIYIYIYVCVYIESKRSVDTTSFVTSICLKKLAIVDTI